MRSDFSLCSNIFGSRDVEHKEMLIRWRADLVASAAADDRALQRRGGLEPSNYHIQVISHLAL